MKRSFILFFVLLMFFLCISFASAESEGVFSLCEGKLVYLLENGEIAKNTTVDNFCFDENGFYTSGDDMVDTYVREVLENNTDDSMSQEERLRAVYKYVVNNCSYRIGNIHEVGEDGWQIDEAKYMIEKNNRGNCYAFAAIFRELARAVGYPAEAYSGEIKGMETNRTPHGWVEIEIDGEVYFFDTEIEQIHLYDDPCDMYMMPLDSPDTLRWGYNRDPEK